MLPILIFWLAINAPWLLGFRVELQNNQVKLLPDRRKRHHSDQSFSRERSAPSSVDGVGQSQSESRPPDFFNLLPKAIHGDIVYLKAELHYLLVVTSSGRGLILYNLKDAIDQLDPSKGMQTHRSWWLNFDYIDSVKKVGRQGKAIMTNGDPVLISRRYFPDFLECYDLLCS